MRLTEPQTRLVNRVRRDGYLVFTITDGAYRHADGTKAIKRVVSNCLKKGALIENGDALFTDIPSQSVSDGGGSAACA